MTGEQPVWIRLLTGSEQAAHAGGDGPLTGLTFAIKDNIDLVGVPTTAADPRRRDPAPASAVAVARLIGAGAAPLGKTNLDQYATGLVGTRSPYGACHAVSSPLHVSGGSSSGSAVAVAEGLVDFALGTDTAGSGRVPAAFNGIVGIKPTRGAVSTRGVVPACRSLDCVTVFARDVATARAAYEVMVGYDELDPYSRRVVPAPLPLDVPVIGIPDTLDGLDPLHSEAWELARVQADKVGRVVPVDVGPLLEAAELLYGGPWLAERLLAFGDALDDDPAVDPVVRQVVAGATSLSAVDVFAGFERLAVLARAAEAVWSGVDAILLPVTPTHPTLAEVAADPVAVNSRLGRFTNMTNLLDLCAVAVPAAPRGDGLPFGVQFLAPAGHDDTVANLAATWCGEDPVVERGPATTLLAVAGAHLSGQPLNGDLVARGGRLVRTTRMAAGYRMFVVDGPLPRPGVTRLGDGGDDPGPEVEVWELPSAAIGAFAATIAPPLGIGPVDLADGSRLLGFLCSADGVDPSRDITAYGGWREWLRQQQ